MFGREWVYQEAQATNVVIVNDSVLDIPKPKILERYPTVTQCPL